MTLNNKQRSVLKSQHSHHFKSRKQALPFLLALVACITSASGCPPLMSGPSSSSGFFKTRRCVTSSRSSGESAVTLLLSRTLPLPLPFVRGVLAKTAATTGTALHNTFTGVLYKLQGGCGQNIILLHKLRYWMSEKNMHTQNIHILMPSNC